MKIAMITVERARSCAEKEERLSYYLLLALHTGIIRLANWCELERGQCEEKRSDMTPLSKLMGFM